MLSRRLALAAPALWAGASQAACAAPAVVLEGPASAGAVVVFGQAFLPGAVPAGMGIAAQGGAIPAQLDVQTRHDDGSARWAVLALACPALAAGARLAVTLTPAPPPAPAPAPAAAARDVTSLLAGRAAVLQVGGWRLDLLAGMTAALRVSPWQSGPLAWQARVTQPVPAQALGGIASLRAVADVALRADGSLWVDAWLRNDIAMRPNGGEAGYAMSLSLDGREALAARIERQHQYTGWGRLLGSARGGAVPVAAHVRHDAGYLADAAAVARYGTAVGIEEGLLQGLATAMATPGWAAPLGPRGLTRDMRQTGGRSDIGPATMPQAAWLISGDRRAAAFAIGQAEAAGAIPWHFWDAGTAGWLDTRAWPRLWTDGRGGPAPGGLAQPIAADTGWVTDCAHQPDAGFVPFLLTGRRSLLDNLQAQAAWCVLSQWPAAASRGVAGTGAGVAGGVAGGVAEGVNVVRGNQVRGAAWSMRQLGNAAWMTPPGDPSAGWLRGVAAANWAWLAAQLPGWTQSQGEAHGRIPGEYGTPGVIPPWQQDQFASTAALAAQRGSPQARAVLGWMANFLVGRFAAAGFAPHDGCAYLIATGEARSWAALGAATRAAGLSNGDGWSKSQGDYAQLALQSLASIQDTLGGPAVARARQWLAQAGAPFTTPRDYRRDPIYNIVPRSGPAPRC